MNILLFGSRGYIGTEFQKRILFSENNLIVAPTFDSFKTVTDFRNFIKLNNVNFVINAAGYTGKPNVDACETDKENCYYGNVIFPLLLAEACRQEDIPFGHVSSGCIYGGYKKAFTEEDEPNFSFVQGNCSFYSGTKAHAEKLLKEYNNCYIWRLRIPFDNTNNPRNYITKLLNYKRLLNLPNSISHKSEFVNACLQCIEKNVPFGIYNVTNTGFTSAEHVIELFNNSETLQLNKSFFSSEEEFYKEAKAPRSNCILDNSKLLSVDIKMRTVEEALTDSIKNYEF